MSTQMVTLSLVGYSASLSRQRPAAELCVQVSPGVYLKLVELQEVRVHDGGRSDGRQQAALLRTTLRQQPVCTLTGGEGVMYIDAFIWHMCVRACVRVYVCVYVYVCVLHYKWGHLIRVRQ